MPSQALARWQSEGAARLDELESVHTAATGPAPGRRWSTEQLNRSLFVALVAQFQRFVRELHDEMVDVHVSVANPEQAALLRRFFTENRGLDTRTPRSDVLGRDFGKFGFDAVKAFRNASHEADAAVIALDLLVDFRNAIGHGNEDEIEAIVGGGAIRATKGSYREYRRHLGRLAVTMDAVASARLAGSLGIPNPW